MKGSAILKRVARYGGETPRLPFRGHKIMKGPWGISEDEDSWSVQPDDLNF